MKRTTEQQEIIDGITQGLREAVAYKRAYTDPRPFIQV